MAEFELLHKIKIVINDLPIQWIPKIELYYPDLPQFPIMYIHFMYNNQRIIACPVVVNYEVKGAKCDATFLVLCNTDTDTNIKNAIKNEISNRIGASNPITLDTVKSSCKGEEYKRLMSDLWGYIEKSYGPSIPFGRFFEEIFSIVRFVSAWVPKTGRQSEMRMLYNFMSSFGEKAKFPQEWSHLEYYIIPLYSDVKERDFKSFPKFSELYSAMSKLYNLDFTKTYAIRGQSFKVMPHAWPKKKEDFSENVSDKYYNEGKITEKEKKRAEKLVDAFNRHPWRAAFFISSIMTIQTSDYQTWSKEFFNEFYGAGKHLKGYSEKVIACFLQQGFGKDDIIPIDTWVKTFYQFPLGIQKRTSFYSKFEKLGKLERVIWLASQSNKTNMKNFFDILWCQRFGTNGNGKLRGVNPLACHLCKLKETCIGLSKIMTKQMYVDNNGKTPEDIKVEEIIPKVEFFCSLKRGVPKEIYKKPGGKKNSGNDWPIIDAFSGYQMDSKHTLSDNIISKKVITVQDFLNDLSRFSK